MYDCFCSFAKTTDVKFFVTITVIPGPTGFYTRISISYAFVVVTHLVLHLFPRYCYSYDDSSL